MSMDRSGCRIGAERSRHDRSSSNVSSCQFPLRMLVSRESVGAIIGKGGSTIRNITRETKARVDVSRKEYNANDKAVTVYGTPESQSQACERILTVMIEEASLTNSRGEIVLKILAHDDLVGRLIGKDGQTIKKIMKDSNTKINVSSLSQLSGDNVDRAITIQGTLHGMVMAEALVSERLRKSFNDDLQIMTSSGQQNNSNASPNLTEYSNRPGNPGTANMYERKPRGRSPFVRWHPENLPSFSPVDIPPEWAAGYAAIEQMHEKETVRVIVPVSSIGAIIGRKGSSIRNLKWTSGATIKLASEPPQEGSGEDDKNSTREISITGFPEQQWKAQSLIYDKMKTDSSLTQDPKFCVEMTISNSKVGKLIGKRGGNIKELMARTGARIIIENDSESTGNLIPDVACSGVSNVNVNNINVRGPSLAKIVRISGSFNAVQLAQRQIRSLLSVHLFRQPRKLVVPSIPPSVGLRGDGNLSQLHEPLLSSSLE